LAALWPVVAGAAICEVKPVPRPDDFPNQPINLFIPRERSSGAQELADHIAHAVRNLTDSEGRNLGIEVNVLFKYGGDAEVAMDYFARLPPNGYNVIWLNDTYASLIASRPAQSDDLIPLSLSQIAFSQIYIPTDDDRFQDLWSFVEEAAKQTETPLRIARFGSDTAADDASATGLEDILVNRFAATFPQSVGATGETPAVDTQPLPLQQVGFQSGSARYFSLFDQTADRPTDALIEQPGDVARLIHEKLLRPIFTLLPQDKVTPEFTERLGPTQSFSDAGDTCQMLYRFRGVFAAQQIPADRRAFLEWVFLSAFNSDSFQKVNHDDFISLLYSDPDIQAAYCTASAGQAFFDDRVRAYRACFQSSNAETRDITVDVPDD